MSEELDIENTQRNLGFLYDEEFKKMQNVIEIDNKY